MSVEAPNINIKDQDTPGGIIVAKNPNTEEDLSLNLQINDSSGWTELPKTYDGSGKVCSAVI